MSFRKGLLVTEPGRAGSNGGNSATNALFVAGHPNGSVAPGSVGASTGEQNKKRVFHHKVWRPPQFHTYPNWLKYEYEYTSFSRLVSR